MAGVAPADAQVGAVDPEVPVVGAGAKDGGPRVLLSPLPPPDRGRPGWDCACFFVVEPIFAPLSTAFVFPLRVD